MKAIFAILLLYNKYLLFILETTTTLANAESTLNGKLMNDIIGVFLTVLVTTNISHPVLIIRQLIVRIYGV